jgi:glycine/D-amino acid oxidase-like deaminating enzyme
MELKPQAYLGCEHGSPSLRPKSPNGLMRTNVAVIGLGAMGAAVLYRLARLGFSVVGIDRSSPPHNLGSSHGETRITRCAVGEGDEYVAFVLRSHAIWRELERETGEILFDACGFLMIARHGVTMGLIRGKAS